MAGGKLIVFSAPSGSGKTTIVQHLLKLEKLNLDFSISATSREPRKGEFHGQDYYFISLKQFKLNQVHKKRFMFPNKNFKLINNWVIFMKKT